MSTRLLTTSATLSTSAGSWARAEAQNFGVDMSGANYDDANTARNTAGFVHANAVNNTGAFLCFKRIGTTGTVTIKLQKAGVDVPGATVTLNVNATNFPKATSFRYVSWAGVAVDAVSTYRYVITATNANQIFLMRSSTAGDYTYAAIGDGSSAAPSSGDAIIIDKSQTLTLDQTLTLAPVSNFQSIYLGDSATIQVTPPAATPITLTLGAGTIVMGGGSAFKAGTSGSPIPANAQFQLASSYTGSNGLFQTWNWPFANLDYTPVIEFYGASSTQLYLDVSSNTTTSSNVLNTTQTVSAGWNVGDIVKVVGKDTTSVDTVYYKINAKGANSISLGTLAANVPVNVNVTVLAGARIINLDNARANSGCYINLTVNAINRFVTTGADIDHYVLSGLYMNNVSPSIGSYVEVTNPTRIDNVVVDCQGSSSNLNVLSLPFADQNSLSNASSGLSGFHYTTSVNSVQGWNINGTNTTFDIFTLQGVSTISSVNANLTGTGYTFTNFLIANTSQYGINWAGTAPLISTGYLLGTNAFMQSGAFTMNGVLQQRSGANGITFGNSSGTCNNCTFGVGSTNTADIGFGSSTFSQILCNNCTVGSAGVGATYTTTINGSYLEFHNYGGTIGDHRTWKKYGKFTTPSPYTTLIEESSNSANSLSHKFQLLSNTIATIQHYLVAIGNIPAAYYSGTSTVPKVIIYTDGNLTTPSATLSLTNTTGDQTVAQAFTPTTSNNQVILDFQTKTNQTGANAQCSWKSAKIVQANYGKTFTVLNLGISETLTYPIATLATTSNDSNIAQATQATVHAYSNYAFDSALKTLTLTGFRDNISKVWTIDDIYDLFHDYFALNPSIFARDGDFNVVGNTFNLPSGWSVIINGTKVAASTTQYLNGASTSNPSRTLAGTVTIGANGVYEDSNGVQFNLAGTIYYATHFWLNTKKASDGVTNIQTSIVSFIDSGGNDRTYDTSLSQTALVTDSSGNVEGYAVYKIGATTYTGHKLQVGHYNYQWQQTPITIDGSTIGSSSVYSTQLLAIDSSITLSQATADAAAGITVNQSTKVVNMNSNTLSLTMHWLKSQQTKIANIDTVNSIKGYLNFYTVSTYSDTGLILRFDLTNYFGAYSWTFSNSGFGGTLFIRDSSGTTTSAATQIILTGLVSGSTVQIYDTTSSTQLYNAVVAATTLTYQYTWTANDTLRIRARYALGTVGYVPYEYSQSVTNTGLSLVVNQEVDTAFNSNNIDGSTVTEATISGSILLVSVDDPDNRTTAQRIYNRYQYLIADTTLVGLQPNDIIANTPNDYTFADALKIYNVDLINPLFISGANINNVTGDGQVIDSSGGSINIVGYFPFPAARDVAAAVWDYEDALSVDTFIGLKRV